MDDLLTTRQLQELLQVDRVTIYRMLSDGRLRGFKVGGQWRFSQQEIEAWIHIQQVKAEGLVKDGAETVRLAPSRQALPLACINAIQGICAEVLDVAVVTVDLDGTPLSEISDPCRFCELILSTPAGARGCHEAWRRIPDGQAQLCHAGLLCITAPIRVSGKTIAASVVCQFTREQATWRQELSTLADQLGLGERELRAAAGSVHVVSDQVLMRIIRLARRMAETFSEIGQERLHLLSRLQHIAEISKIQ